MYSITHKKFFPIFLHYHMSHFISNPPVHTIGSFLFFILFSIFLHNHEVSIPSEHFISERIYLIFKIYLVFEISKIYLRQMYCCAGTWGPRRPGDELAAEQQQQLVTITFLYLQNEYIDLYYAWIIISCPCYRTFLFFDLFSRSNH